MKRTIITLLLLLCIAMANAQGIITHPAPGKTTAQKKHGTTPARRSKSGTTSSAAPSLPRPTLGTSNYTPNVRSFRVGNVTFEMVEVQGGTFTMGTTKEQDASYIYKSHKVTLSGYYIGRTEVTQELWKEVMNYNPSYFQEGDKRPVVTVTWNDCQAFISKLNALTGQNFRLPTEAEWEFAARGGTKSRGYKYSGSNTLDDVAWCKGNSGDNAHDVASKHPNELGIYDMSGNASEWCSDWYDLYSSSAQTNPTGPAKGGYRVNRGGFWNNDAYGYCPSSRDCYDPSSNPPQGAGLRLCMSE